MWVFSHLTETKSHAQTFAAAVADGPYATCGYGSPGAMKFVLGFFWAFAAEQRAIVGELYRC
jgi:hypothetical protein